MRRTWLVLVLVAFSVLQATEALALVAPDDCATVTERAGTDDHEDCPIQCARCLCCARRPASIRQDITTIPFQDAASSVPEFVRSLHISSVARDVFHVPKLSPHRF